MHALTVPLGRGPPGTVAPTARVTRLIMQLLLPLPVSSNNVLSSHRRPPPRVTRVAAVSAHAGDSRRPGAASGASSSTPDEPHSAPVRRARTTACCARNTRCTGPRSPGPRRGRAGERSRPQRPAQPGRAQQQGGVLPLAPRVPVELQAYGLPHRGLRSPCTTATLAGGEERASGEDADTAGADQKPRDDERDPHQDHSQPALLCALILRLGHPGTVTRSSGAYQQGGPAGWLRNPRGCVASGTPDGDLPRGYLPPGDATVAAWRPRTPADA